ncbi:hypothetical protein VM98_33510, partial [Streptomyces rubellomurinus subsp. indigoferus]
AETDLARMARSGIRPMSADEALALLDAALHRDAPVLAPARLDPAPLAPRAALPPTPSPPVRAPRRPTPAPAPPESPPTLTHPLAALPEAQQRQLMDDLVRGHAATVLGHGDPLAVDMHRRFLELGFDSLTAA